MNKDTFYNILLNSDIDNIEKLALVNQSFYQLYQDPNFWKNKILYDFNVSLDIILKYINTPVITGKNWQLLYYQIQRAIDIYNNNKIPYLLIDLSDYVLESIYFIFTQGDINFIEAIEEYDNIVKQFIRIEHQREGIFFQYTEVGDKNYGTIYTYLDNKQLIEVLTIILYNYPNTKIS